MEEMHHHHRKSIMEMELPHDVLLFLILPRLPARSLLRFMRVSKKWYSFLKIDMFANMHLLHVTNDDHQNHNRFFVISLKAEKLTFHTIDCESPYDSLSVNRPFPFEATLFKMTPFFSIIASCNGLVCVPMVNRSTSEFTDLRIWNPLTGEYKSMSSTNSHKDCYSMFARATGFYHNSSVDDYRLLRVTVNRKVYIYPLKTDSWRQVNTSIPHCNCDSERWASCVHLNDNLYFLKEVREGRLLLKACSIIRFDTKTEKFTEITFPPFKNPIKTYCLSLMVLRGCVHMCVMCDIREEVNSSPKWCIELWKMNGNRNGYAGDWTKVLSYWWIPCLKFGPRLDVILKNGSLPCSLLPLHLMRNGSLLMRSTFEGDFHKVDSEKHTNNESTTYGSRCMSIPLAGKYVETFVSPNQYIKLN